MVNNRRKYWWQFMAGFAFGFFLFGLFLEMDLISEEKVLGVSISEKEENIVVQETTSVSSTPTVTPTFTPTPTLTLEPTLSPTPTLTPTPTPTPTPIQPPASLEPLFKQYAAHYRVDEQLLVRIAWCESRFNIQAVNGPYLGLYQFSEERWIAHRTVMGHDTNPDLRANAEESIKTAAYLISLGKLFMWPNCVN